MTLFKLFLYCIISNDHSIPAVLPVIICNPPSYSNCSCRATEWPFWFGLILPFLAIYIFNWIVFVLILVSVCKHTNNLKDKSRAEKLRGIRSNFIVAMCLAVVLGLGWGLGLLATSSDILEVTVLFQVLFSIFVGMQGVLIFFLHGVRNKDARDLWKQCTGAVTRKSRPKYFVSSDRMAPTGTSHDLRSRETHSIGLTTLPPSTLPQDSEANSNMMQSTLDSENVTTFAAYDKNSLSEVQCTDIKNNELESYQSENLVILL